MTLPGLSRPMRTGGFVLLGVAVVAAVIGTASAVTGDDDDPGTARPTGEQPSPTTSGTQGNGGGTPTASPPGETSPGEEQTTTSEPRSTTPTQTTSPQQGTKRPGQTEGPGGQPGAPDGKGGDSVKAVPVRVYNNSNISNLAARAADDLRARGWNVVDTGNYSEGVIHTTTAYYRPGTNEQAAAREIGDEFGMRVARRFEGIKDSSAGVIVIVTKDYAGADSGGKGGK